MANDKIAYKMEDIVVLDGLEAVRRRPGMYIGDVHDGSGLHHMLWELVANSVDEHLAGYASRIRVSVDPGIAEVEDDGRGIPVEVHRPSGMPLVQWVLTRLHVGPTFDQHVPHVHLAPGGFGLGLAPINALSEELEVEIRRNGYSWTQRFARGVPLTELERGARTDRTGTRIRFRPDPTIFSSTRFDRHAIRKRIRELAIWNPGLTWELMSEVIREPGGTARWIERLAAKNQVDVAGEPFVTRTVRNGVFVEVACAWSASARCDVRSFVGQNRTGEGGTHVAGFWQGLVAAIASQRPSAFRRVPPAARWRGRLRPGLLAVVHVGLQNPLFAGPTRDRLESREAGDAVRDQVTEAFAAHLVRHPGLARTLLARVCGGGARRPSAER